MTSIGLKGESRYLTCGICGKLYDKPRLLACLHTFCTKCIEGIDSYVMPPNLVSDMALRSELNSDPATGSNYHAGADRSSPVSCDNDNKYPKNFRTLGSCSKGSCSGATSGYESEPSPAESVVTPSPTTPIPCLTTSDIRGNKCDTSTDVPRQSTDSTVNNQKRRTIVCPTCDSEVDMPEGGASHLPPNYVVQNKINAAVAMTSTTVSGSDSGCLRASCSLCVGEAPALTWCADCSIHLCAFCSEAHKRQRNTGSHQTLPLDEASTHIIASKVEVSGTVVSAGELWPTCRRHITEELKLFCETCMVTLCQQCASASDGEHRAHPLCSVSSNDARTYIDSLAALLTRTRARAEEIRVGLASVRATAKRVHSRHSEVGREVEQFADDYVKAVNRHRENLLERVRLVGATKQRVLKLQGVHLEQALEDVQSSCAFVEQLLAEGSDAEVLSLAGHVSRRLRELGLEKQLLEPRVDEFIDFAPTEPAGRVAGFPVKGTVSAQRVCPSQCALKGNALPVARQGNKCDMILVTKDSEGQLMRRGGTSPNVKLLSKINDKEIPVKVTDLKDGTYSISFQTEELGLFWLHIKILGKYIQGSPYPLPIKPKRLKHYGIFHCCTFCSSGGRKLATCGCGGTMQGGFKGCGHGHQGHPGKRHWSCCGRVGENSECISIPKVYQVSL